MPGVVGADRPEMYEVFAVVVGQTVGSDSSKLVNMVCKGFKDESFGGFERRYGAGCCRDVRITVGRQGTSSYIHVG